jgi:hypothetical protein
MEGACKDASYPGWEGLPLERCRYAVPERGGRKYAEVIMLNPSKKKLRRWIDNACRAALGEADATCRDRLRQRVLVQSGGQFPVAGIVLEDIRPTDGRYEAYCFRHGVTVEVEGFPHASTDPPTESTLAACLEGRVTRPRTFARLAGTAPSEYRAHGGSVDVGTDAHPTMAWLDVSRELYVKAWRSKHNELMEAWAKAHRAALR